MLLKRCAAEVFFNFYMTQNALHNFNYFTHFTVILTLRKVLQFYKRKGKGERLR